MGAVKSVMASKISYKNNNFYYYLNFDPANSLNPRQAPQLINTRQLAISAAGKTAGQTQKKLPLQLIPSKAEARGQKA